MHSLTSANLRAPYLIFIGDIDNPTYAKTGLGIVQWRKEFVAGQLRFPGNTLDLDVPDLSAEQAVLSGVNSLIIGVAPVGGSIGKHWEAELLKGSALGMDIVSGLHTRLEDIPGLADAALSSGAKLINIRIPPVSIPIATGQKRSGRRVLMVGTDCAVGKKYTALALTDSLKKTSIKATFRATGQTGIMIAGTGIPIDAVVSDFVAGAAELISPDNEENHWDVIEGQGSLFHPAYAGVSLGLLHGSQPDAIVVCHDASRHHIDSCPDFDIPSIKDCIDLNLQCARLTNPAVRCVGISVNTSSVSGEDRSAYLQSLMEETGLPCVDCVIDGCDAIAKNINQHFYLDKPTLRSGQNTYAQARSIIGYHLINELWFYESGDD